MIQINGVSTVICYGESMHSLSKLRFDNEDVVQDSFVFNLPGIFILILQYIANKFLCNIFFKLPKGKSFLLFIR